ncbi:hypothetical protein [uncultured Methylobacterium sp.]|jgi:polyhydroxyalkanoate synthesis regulator phasin|uniref:hypothetical protein n=1 Tax=uncultured Methylobacterium sp. TaxID=157278 RepID=UPI0026353297|nr:hypothetical protein [uncultured Methylobacterium sp.]
MLDAVVTDINTVPEALRPSYKEDNGKFVLQVRKVDGFALENITGLTNALSAERTLKETAEAALKPFKDIDANTARQAIALVSQYGDVTPEKAKQLATDFARLSAIDPSKEADRLAGEKVETAVNAARTEFGTKETQYQGQIEALQGGVEKLKGQLRTLMVGNVVKGEIGKLGPVPGNELAIELLAERQIKTVEKDGQFEVQVLGEDGNPRFKLEGTALVPFTVSDLMAEIKEKSPGLFAAENKGGIGITPGTGPSRSATQGNPWTKEAWNRTEQAKITKSNPTEAARLKAQAGVA